MAGPSIASSPEHEAGHRGRPGSEWGVLAVGALVAIALVAIPATWTSETRFVVRLIHLVTGLGWLGEVMAVNVVLLPAVGRIESAARGPMLVATFPLVFRLATALAGLALLSGATLFVMTSGGDVAGALGTAWGQRILLGGVLGGALFAFHLFQESAWEGSLASRLVSGVDDPMRARALLRRLRVLPAIGMVVLLIVVTLMSAAGHLA